MKYLKEYNVDFNDWDEEEVDNEEDNIKIGDSVILTDSYGDILVSISYNISDDKDIFYKSGNSKGWGGEVQHIKMHKKFGKILYVNGCWYKSSAFEVYHSIKEYVEIDDLNWDEDLGIEDNDNKLIKLINREVNSEEIMGVKVKSKNWEQFANFLIRNDITWKTRRSVDIDDKNIRDRSHIVVIFKRNHGKLVIGFSKSEDIYIDTFEETCLFIFRNKQGDLSIDILWEP